MNTNEIVLEIKMNYHLTEERTVLALNKYCLSAEGVLSPADRLIISTLIYG